MLNFTDDTCYNLALVTVLALVLLFVLRTFFSQENFAEKHHHSHHKHHGHTHHKHHGHTHHKHHAHHAASPKVEAKPEIPVGPQDTTVTGHLQLPNDFMLSADADGWLRHRTHDGQKYKNLAGAQIWADNGVLSQGCDFVLGGNCSRGDSGPSRALVKDQGPQLVINYANDFKQGTRVDGDFYLNNNKLHFDNYNNNSSDPYYLQKVVSSPNNSHLRLTINDDNDESFQIWGNSCGEAGGCGGDGAMKHKFVANGDAFHVGTTHTGKLQLGEKFLLSGVGDAEANDEWLRLKGPSGPQYYGGFAAGKMWTFGGQYLQSDRRIKTDIRELDSSNVLSKINKLKGYTYRLKLSENDKKVYGLIAQEVKREFPELVEEGPNGLLSIDSSQMSALLIEAINELSKNL